MELGTNLKSSRSAYPTPPPSLCADEAPHGAVIVPVPGYPDCRNRSYCYTHHIRPADQEHFTAAKSLIREIVHKALDISLTWKAQGPGRVEDLLASVLSAYPEFNNYEKHWPILWCCQHRLYFIRSCIRRGTPVKDLDMAQESQGVASAKRSVRLGRNGVSASRLSNASSGYRDPEERDENADHNRVRRSLRNHAPRSARTAVETERRPERTATSEHSPLRCMDWERGRS
ncbi:hypothetical protein C8Q74DRAFT_782347 [Fomes fomentarius]|nr:hypothetical protein C8Q74DRAFT_782347 [Fomes fomentarius]